MQKKRLIVLTDISTLEAGMGEADDTQSLIRLLFYADQFRLERFAATYTSHMKKACPEFILDILMKYKTVRENLLRFSRDYPDADSLMAKVWRGVDAVGHENVGEGKDTEASRNILRVADESPEPLWIIAWGGITDLAQMLWTAEKTKTSAAFGEFLSKLRIYAIGDQYDQCGPPYPGALSGIILYNVVSRIPGYVSFREHGDMPDIMA